MEDKNIKSQNTAEGARGFTLRTLGRDLFLGCVAIMPLALFIFCFYYLIGFFEAIGALIFGLTKSQKSTALISCFLIVTLISIGRKLRRRETSILSLLEHYVITKIPVLGGWYTALRDILQTFTSGGGNTYLGTAKVPAGPGYIIGFVSRRETLADGTVQVTVFVPTSPNPTTGLVFFFPEDQIEYLDLSPEKAFTKIISLGVKS